MAVVRSVGQIAFVVLVVVGLTVPAAAALDDPTQNVDSRQPTAAIDTPTDSANDSRVNVTVGQQLATIIDVSSDEVQTDFENTAFEVSVEVEDEEDRVEAIAERAVQLRERAEDISEGYEEATEAYEAGELTTSQYAQRLAALNARASNLHTSYEQFQQRAERDAALERSAGINQSALEEAVANLSSVSGPGPAALFEQFTGESRGEIELETTNGLKIEIESEDGEQSREIKRSRDDDYAITVEQSAALETARTALSMPENATWALSEAKVKREDGAYEFEFVLRDAPGQTGEAEVRVDGSSGEVFKLEEEIEARDDDEYEGEKDEEHEDDEHDLAILVVDGSPAPNATVTLAVLADDAAVESATVYLNDRTIGTTGPNGTVTVTLPEAGEAELKARLGDAEGELEFEFEEEEKADEDDGDDEAEDDEAEADDGDDADDVEDEDEE